MGFLNFIKSLFGKKEETKKDIPHVELLTSKVEVVEPVEKTWVPEKTEVEKMTDRLHDVASTPLTKVETPVEEPTEKPSETTVKEIKSKSRKPKSTTAKVETEKPKSKPSKSNSTEKPKRKASKKPQ